MESYIVRIYRRDAEDPEKIVGIVELISRDQKNPFRDMDELRELLLADGEKGGGAIKQRD